MMLRAELRKRLLEERGIYVTEACDTCGQLLGPVRYRRAEIRKGGRPRKYQTAEQAHSAKMELRRFRRNSPNEAKTPLQLTANKALADAKMASLVVHP